jgi:hypothetical protein
VPHFCHKRRVWCNSCASRDLYCKSHCERGTEQAHPHWSRKLQKAWTPRILKSYPDFLQGGINSRINSEISLDHSKANNLTSWIDCQTKDKLWSWRLKRSSHMQRVNCAVLLHAAWYMSRNKFRKREVMANYWVWQLEGLGVRTLRQSNGLFPCFEISFFSFRSPSLLYIRTVGSRLFIFTWSHSGTHHSR